MKRNVSHMLTYEQALQKMTSLCSISEHCEHDVRGKLYKWGISTKDSDRIVDYLLDEGYLDENRFAMSYANDKLRFSHWGRLKIRSMLQALRISDACIGEALARIDPEEYERILVRVLDGKRRTMDECESYDARIKIIRFALQRGFEISEITKFVDET